MWPLIFLNLPSFPQTLQMLAKMFFPLPSLCLPLGIKVSLFPIKEFTLSLCSSFFLQSWWFVLCFSPSLFDTNFCPQRLQAVPRWLALMCFFITLLLPSFPQVLHMRVWIDLSFQSQPYRTEFLLLLCNVFYPPPFTCNKTRLECPKGVKDKVKQAEGPKEWPKATS